EYKLSRQLKSGRGVYSFCMCPGGQVVCSSSEEGMVATNGMSLHVRDGENANSALLVSVNPGDFGSDDVLAGVEFQRRYERAAFLAGGGDYRAPAQRVEDFLKNRASRRFGDVTPSYMPGVRPANLGAALPDFAFESMCEALPQMGRLLRGFDHPDAVLTGVETRSSAPVRIERGADGCANIGGLYPTGEGAGWAGGIMSAAVDGIRQAQRVLGINE
ncbi:MAG: NAD(P)/FAD-dependent oxidoreductase, partial [Christensenellales bacterium]